MGDGSGPKSAVKRKGGGRKSNALAYAWDVARFHATGYIPWTNKRAWKKNLRDNPPEVEISYNGETANPYR
jgi:hypothetical protein